MSFDPQMVVVPEADARAQDLRREIKERRSEVDSRQASIHEHSVAIETHKMHIATCEAALQVLSSVLPEDSLMQEPMSVQTTVQPGY